MHRHIHPLFLMLICLCVVCIHLGGSSHWLLQWIGAEIRQNFGHSPAQLLPPLIPLSFLTQQTWKLPPGQETSLQHPSKMQADGGTDRNRASDKLD